MDPRRRRPDMASRTSPSTPGETQAYVAETEHLEGGIPVVSVMGEVDMATAPAFEETLLEAADNGTNEVIVDLTACSYFDSTGLKALLATRRHFERLERRLSLVVSNPNMMEIFRITGFDRRFHIHPSLGSALSGGGHV
jgi:anti-sigma B factor antagonist